MKAFYKNLFEYNYQMNQKVIKAFVHNSDKASEKAVQWMNHVLNAHQIWNNRIDPQEEVSAVWQVHSLGKLTEMDRKNFDRSLEIIGKVDFERSLTYTNSKGLHFTNQVKDVLMHVINHSTYHRGQIASDFRSSGIQPEITDYIAFMR